MTQWKPVVGLSRSDIDRRTWTPHPYGGDDLDFPPHRYAGGLRTVRLWAEQEYVAPGQEHRWVQAERDLWVLETDAPWDEPTSRRQS